MTPSLGRLKNTTHFRKVVTIFVRRRRCGCGFGAAPSRGWVAGRLWKPPPPPLAGWLASVPLENSQNNNGIELHNRVFVLRLIQVCTRKYKNWESIPTAIRVWKMRTTIVEKIKVVSTNFHHDAKQISNVLSLTTMTTMRRNVLGLGCSCTLHGQMLCMHRYEGACFNHAST